jgi:hypothetical protein
MIETLNNAQETTAMTIEDFKQRPNQVDHVKHGMLILLTQ